MLDKPEFLDKLEKCGKKLFSCLEENIWNKYTNRQKVKFAVAASLFSLLIFLGWQGAIGFLVGFLIDINFFKKTG